MNESTLTQLKILVERAVRPLRACISRKKKMREELLAHVTTVYDEEANLGDESTALTRTAQRFGDAAELTRHLQATVPTRDRLAGDVESLLGFPPHGSTIRLAARHGILVAAMITPMLGLMIVFMSVISVPWTDWLTVYRLPSLLTPIYLGVLTFCGSVVVQGMTEALFSRQGRSWPRIVGYGVAAWLLVPAVSLAACMAFTGVFFSTALDVWPLFLTGLLGPAALLIVAYAAIGEIRYCEEWASLPIDELKGVRA